MCIGNFVVVTLVFHGIPTFDILWPRAVQRISKSQTGHIEALAVKTLDKQKMKHLKAASMPLSFPYSLSVTIGWFIFFDSPKFG